MRSLREHLVSALVTLALRLQPGERPAPRAPSTRGPVWGPHPSAHVAAGQLRMLASDIDSGMVHGCRVVWHGAPCAADVFVVLPRAIGDA